MVMVMKIENFVKVMIVNGGYEICAVIVDVRRKFPIVVG